MLIESNLSNEEIKNRFNINFEVVKEVIEEFFEEKIKIPVFIHIDGRLGNRRGATCGNYREGYSSFKGMSEYFINKINDYKTSFPFHHIKLAATKLTRETKFHFNYWKSTHLYDQETVSSNSKLCFFFHVLIHELGHAIQFENASSLGNKLNYIKIDDGIIYVKNTLSENASKTHILDAQKTYSDYHQSSFSELDAESYSRDFSPVIVEMYLEKIKK